jgi:hypothetical protein
MTYLDEKRPKMSIDRRQNQNWLSLIAAVMTLAGACKARTSESIVAGSVNVEATPPQSLFHFGSYRDFKVYIAKREPPSPQEWASIPSNGAAYEPARRGLYGAQHPAYAERYGGEFLAKGFENGPWLVRLVLNPACAGSTNKSVISDSRWPNSGFWIVRSRECLADVEAHPTEVLQIFATVPELWSEKPYTTEKSRREDDKHFSYKVLTAVLITALVMTDNVETKTFNDMLAIAHISDDQETRDLISSLLRVARHCNNLGQWQNFRQQLAHLVADGTKLFDNSAKTQLPSLCRDAAQALSEPVAAADKAIAKGSPPDEDVPKTAPANPAKSEEPASTANPTKPKLRDLHECGRHRSLSSCRGDVTGYCAWIRYKSINWCVDRLANCSEFAYDGAACNNETEGRCHYGPYKSINWCYDLAADCGELAQHKAACERATDNRCVYAAYKSIYWCFSRDAACGEFSADRVVCDTKTNNRCAYGQYRSINWCYDRDAECHTILDRNVCETRAKKSCKWTGNYCSAQ